MTVENGLLTVAKKEKHNHEVNKKKLKVLKKYTDKKSNVDIENESPCLSKEKIGNVIKYIKKDYSLTTKPTCELKKNVKFKDIREQVNSINIETSENYTSRATVNRN